MSVLNAPNRHRATFTAPVETPREHGHRPSLAGARRRETFVAAHHRRSTVVISVASAAMVIDLGIGMAFALGLA